MRAKVKVITAVLLLGLCAMAVPASAIPVGADVAENADNQTAQRSPGTWGNSQGRTGSSATAWGKSDIGMGCAGIKGNSKCYFLVCRYCRR